MNLIGNKVNCKYALLLAFFYIAIFADLIDDAFPIMTYRDEIFAMMAIPLFLWSLMCNHLRVSLSAENSRMCLCVLFYFLLSFFGNVIYKNQNSIIAIVSDIIVNCKFWFSIYIGKNFFGKLDWDIYGYKIAKHIKFFIWIFSFLIIVDNIFSIFPGDIRYGLKSTQLFYDVHTIFAGICAVLVSLVMMLSKYMVHYKRYVGVLLLMMCSTLRSKAFGGVLVFLLIYYIVMLKKKKLDLKRVIGLGIVAALAGWTQIRYYFFSSISDGAARFVLLKYSFRLAKDYFPLGVGFSGFASYFSGVYYSDIYVKYGISNVYGLTENHTSFVSDNFWPMILGQSGILGVIFYIVALAVLFKKAGRLTQIDKGVAVGAYFVLAYLLVASIAESAFVSSIVVMFGCVLGICLGKDEIQ